MELISQVEELRGRNSQLASQMDDLRGGNVDSVAPAGKGTRKFYFVVSCSRPDFFQDTKI